MSLAETVSSWAARRMASWLAKRARYEGGNGSDILRIVAEAFNGTPSAAGISINEDRALTLSAVYTAVRIISGTIKSLPLHVYRRSMEGRREFALRHWAYPLLHDSPNEYHTSATWREIMIAHLLLWGNSYSRIEWLNNGAAGALYPLMPWEVEPYRTPRGEQRYRVLTPGANEELGPDEVLHVLGLGYDGLKGLSVIQYHRDLLGTSKAMEMFTGAFFKNGAKHGGVLEVPGRMDEKSQQNLTESVAAKFGNLNNAFKVMVLEGGAKFHSTTMPLEDAQLIDARKLSRSEIYGLYGVPPHLGGDTERSTSWGTGIEQQDIGYARHTISPLCSNIEQEINRKLFGRGSGLYVKFNLDGLMRGDFKSRMEGYRIAVGAPFLTRNEARELEDWNTLATPGMNDVLTPLNMGVGAQSAPPDPSPPAGGEDGPEGSGDRSIVIHNHLPEQKPADVHLTVPERSVNVNVERQGPEAVNVNAPVTVQQKQPARTITRHARDERGELVKSVAEHIYGEGGDQ